MPLTQGLFKTQDQTEEDLTEGSGWTIDEQKPSMFGGLMGAIPRGIGEGAAAGISMLTHGLHGLTQDLPLPNPVTLMTNPVQAALDIAATKPKPSALEDASKATRDYSKTLTPDPRTTGTAANVIQGFSKAATEFTVGSLAGGPEMGAALLGATDGYAHYSDLKDQGVDDATAEKSGLLTAITSGGSALLPMGMPAKWLKGLSTVGALGAQAGAGAVINTSFGAASRYASAKILDDAGYPEMAEQQKPWDETNLLTDAITGLFFGAHAGWHGLKNLKAADIDPSIRDAAKVVQDRQAVNERAPGVPVDMKSAATHRELLDSALGDLMTGKPVDSAHIDSEGATFARPEVDETQAHDIMREEFVKSGVLDFADDFDRWLAGEEPKPPKEVSIKQPGDAAVDVPPEVSNRVKETVSDFAQAAAERPFDENDVEKARDYQDRLYDHLQTKADEFEAQGDKEQASAYQRAADMARKQKRPPRTFQTDGSVVSEQTPSPLSLQALFDRPDLQIVNAGGEALHAGNEHARATEEEAQANKEAEPMFEAAVKCEARHA